MCEWNLNGTVARDLGVWSAAAWRDVDVSLEDNNVSGSLWSFVALFTRVVRRVKKRRSI